MNANVRYEIASDAVNELLTERAKYVQENAKLSTENEKLSIQLRALTIAACEQGFTTAERAGTLIAERNLVRRLLIALVTETEQRADFYYSEKGVAYRSAKAYLNAL